MKRPSVCAIALALAVTAGPALAKPKVAVVPIDGDPGGEVADLIADLLTDDATVASTKQVTRAMDKLGFDGDLSEKQAKKLANELESDAVVEGSLTSKDGKQVLHLKFFVHGKKVRGFTIEFGSIKSDKFKDAFHDKLVEKVGEGKPKTHGSVSDDDADAKPKKHDDEDADAKPKKHDDDDDADAKPKKHDDDGDDDHPHKKRTARRDDDDGEVDEEVTVAPSPHAANRDAIRVDFGISIETRKLAFTSRAFEQAPKGYSNAPVPGGRLAGEIYPLAFGNPQGIASGIGLGGMLDQTLSLSLTSTAQPGTSFPVTQRQWGIGPRFRIAFGKRPTSPTMTLMVDYGHRTFSIDEHALMPGNKIDLPNTDYAGYSPGLQFRIPLAPNIALLFGGSAFLVTRTGEIGQANQYGQAKVTAGAGMAGLDIVFARRYAVRLVAEIAQMGYAFTGGAEMTNNRDGDPSTPDVGGAADRYIGGAATFGVLY